MSFSAQPAPSPANTVLAALPSMALPTDPNAVFIRVEDLSMRFVLYRQKGLHLKEAVIESLRNRFARLFGRGRNLPARRDTFDALQHISLAIDAGMRLGIIGHNGAGKTTLLRTIARIYQPTAGRIRINGSIAALIEIGSGFDPELTAYENILLGGTLLGRAVKDMRARADAIIDFAGVREFADVPIKYYSTGMNLRLAFAMATDVEPDILLLDELFAGGDREFQARAKDRMIHLVEKTKIMVLVSHNMPLIREFCTHVAWLQHGRLVQVGATEGVLTAFLAAPAAPPPATPAPADPAP